MWMVCARTGVLPVSGNLSRIVLAAGATGGLAWALNETGVPTAAWVAAAAAVYALLLMALGAVRRDELRALLRRAPA